MHWAPNERSHEVRWGAVMGNKFNLVQQRPAKRTTQWGDIDFRPNSDTSF